MFILKNAVNPGSFVLRPSWSTRRYEFDHQYPAFSSSSVTVVVYGQLGTPEFSQFHTVCSEAASLGKIHYVMRHYVPVRKCFITFTFCLSPCLFFVCPSALSVCFFHFIIPLIIWPVSIQYHYIVESIKHQNTSVWLWC